MASELDWESLLEGHPIFTPNDSTTTSERKDELGVSALNAYEDDEVSKRRQIMCLKDSEIIVAYKSEIRMASLVDAKVSGSSEKTYKILHAPNIDFEVHQMRLSPNKKLLAVSGASRVAILVLPRSGFSKMVTSRVDCKSLDIGSYYHCDSMPPIAKIDWHPWGESGSSLLVMTVDGKLREYEVSFDPDEPRRTVDMVPETQEGAFSAIDESEREVASFTFGKGKADWGPLTLYTLTKSGDVYAICPYLPENASVPSSYLHALECFVAAKEEFVAENDGSINESFQALYDYQRKFINGLLKQVPVNKTFLLSAATRVSLKCPKSLLGKPLRQGPFLLQPAPMDLENSPGGNATDIVYVTLGSAFEDTEDDASEATSLASERVGAVLIAFQDGRVDVLLDLEKVEARWETKTHYTPSRPMFAVYECVDLGVLQTIPPIRAEETRSEALRLIGNSHVVFYPDPVHDDTVYAYHAFGIHVLNFNALFQYLAASAKQEEDAGLEQTILKPAQTSVQALLSTYSVERRSADAVAAIAIPSDVYSTHSIFVVTETLRFVSFSLSLKAQDLRVPDTSEKQNTQSGLPLLPSSGPLAYMSILSADPYTIPSVLERPLGLPAIAKVAPPTSHRVEDEFKLTPETLRYLATVASRINSELPEVQVAYKGLRDRAELCIKEFERQQVKVAEVANRARQLIQVKRPALLERINNVQSEQAKLIKRMNRLLEALIKKASPDLNEHETKWFEELKRMKAQVMGVGRFDSDSMKMRTRKLHSDFERLLPELQKLAKEEAERRARDEDMLGAGLTYAKEYEKISKAESERIEDAMEHIAQLAKKLEISGISISRPPF